MYDDVVLRAFSDELQKIALSRHFIRIAKSRSGRRPISVTALLRKEKDGTLYKHTKKMAEASVSNRALVGSALGLPVLAIDKKLALPAAGIGAALGALSGLKSGRLDSDKKLKAFRQLAGDGKLAAAGSEQSRVEYQEVDPANPNGKPARAKDKKGDGPDREAGGNAVKVEARQDMRSSNIAVAQGEKFNAPEGFTGY
jgi:hypothetical protein